MGLLSVYVIEKRPYKRGKGLHVPLVFSNPQSIRFQLCYAAFLKVVESLRFCNGVMRGDSSALIAAHGEFCSMLVTLLHILYSSRKISTFTDTVVMSFDVYAHPASPTKLALPGSVKDILDEQLSSPDNPQRQLFLKRYTVFLSSLVKEIQGILWGSFNGGLKHFEIFSLPILKSLAFEEVKERLTSLISFMKQEKLLITSVVSRWEAELLTFHRDVLAPLDLSSFFSFLPFG